MQVAVNCSGTPQKRFLMQLSSFCEPIKSDAIHSLSQLWVTLNVTVSLSWEMIFIVSSDKTDEQLSTGTLCRSIDLEIVSQDDSIFSVSRIGDGSTCTWRRRDLNVGQGVGFEEG